MADGTDRSMNAYVRAEAEFQARGGYAAEAEAARVAAGLGLPTELMERRLSALSGGQRRRVQPARILLAGHGTLLLDEPTNHLDAASVAWLRTFLTSHQGGLMVISHDTSLPAGTVSRVFHPDPGGRARHPQHRLGHLPGAAGGRRATTGAGAGERRAQGRGAALPGRQDAGAGGGRCGRTEHGAPRRPSTAAGWSTGTVCAWATSRRNTTPWTRSRRSASTWPVPPRTSPTVRSARSWARSCSPATTPPSASESCPAARRPGGPGPLGRERPAPRRAHQQPGPGLPGRGPVRGGHLSGRDRHRHARRGRHRRAAPGPGAAPAGGGGGPVGRRLS